MAVPFKHRKIFLLDDMQETLTSSCSALNDAGYQVITHDRLVGAAAAICYEKPGIALLGVTQSLPGDQVARTLSRTEGHGTILLLHSTLPAETLRLKVLTCGAHGYVRKTKSPQSLVQQVEDWLQPGSKSGPAGIDPAALPSSHSRIKIPQYPSSPNALTASKAADASSGPGARQVASEPPRTVARSGTMRVAVRVLFVHPEPAVLGVLQDTVGAEVTGQYVTTAEEALGHIGSDPSPEVVVVSTSLPGTASEDLYRQTQDLVPAPGPRFVFMAEAAMTEEQSVFVRNAELPVLQAPIAPQQLLRAIWQSQQQRQRTRAR